MDTRVYEACSTAAGNTSTLTYFLIFGLIVIVMLMFMQMNRQREESQRLTDRVKSLQNQNEGLQRVAQRTQGSVRAARAGSAPPTPVRAAHDAPFRPMYAERKTIHDEPMPKNPIDSKTLESTGRVSMGSLTPGDQLWNQYDAFGAKDVKTEDMFPLMNFKPKNVTEALQQMYTPENLSRAHDLDHISYLSPYNSRTGDMRHGMEKDYERERERKRAIIAQLEASGDPEGMLESMMLPLPEEIFDDLTTTARRRGYSVHPEVAANMLNNSQGFGAEIFAGRRETTLSHSQSQDLLKQLARPISTTDWRQAQADMQTLLETAHKALAAGHPLPPMNAHQTAGLARWANDAENKGTSMIANQLADVFRTVIPPRTL